MQEGVQEAVNVTRLTRFGSISLALATIAALAGLAISSEAAASRAAATSCEPKTTSIKGKKAFVFCGPARVTMKMGAKTLRFTLGECDTTGSFFSLQLGTLVPSSANPRPPYFGPYFGLLVQAPRGGVFVDAIVAFIWEGTRYALTSPNNVTLTGSQRRGTFAGRLENGPKVSGSFSC